jgi:hypothetical protein
MMENVVAYLLVSKWFSKEDEGEDDGERFTTGGD